MISLISSFAIVTSLLLAGSATAQGDLTSANNVTGLQGTWSSGIGAVSTGSGFCNPENFSFTYPAVTGISYSFTDTGYFEEAQYRFNANGSDPQCITAYVLWQHGKYQLNNNGSVTLYPFGSDGRIQVQDPCAAVTNIITNYNQITLYANWGITVDPLKQNYMLQLNRFDGAKMPPLYLIANPPNMLPTVVLTGANATGQASRRSLDESSSLKKRSAAAPSIAVISSRTLVGYAAAIGATLAMGVAGLCL